MERQNGEWGYSDTEQAYRYDYGPEPWNDQDYYGQGMYGSGPMNYGSQPPKKKKNIGLIVGLAVGGVAELILIIIVAWLFLGKEEKIETYGDYYVTGCKEVLKVRETEDADSKVVTKLDNGEKVALVEKAADNNWKIYVEAEDAIGYLDSHYLTDNREAAAEPTERFVSIDAEDNASILSNPDGSGTSVGVLKRGDEVTVLSKPSDGYAYIYDADANAYGYVEQSMLAEEKPEEEKPKEEAEEEKEKTASREAKDNSAKARTSTSRNADVIGPGAAPASDKGTYYVNVSKGYLALRNEKSYDASNEIGKMYNGDYVYLLRDDGDYWYVYSPFLGSYGYTNSSYLVSSYSSVSQYSSNVYYANVSKNYLALRSAPSYDYYNEIGQIANGQEVDLIDSSLGTYWYVYVPALDSYGYVNSDYLRR